MKIPFYKCNSKGNSFIIILGENTDNFNPNKITDICNLGDNQKVDGLIFLRESKSGDDWIGWPTALGLGGQLNSNSDIAIMTYYNNDG